MIRFLLPTNRWKHTTQGHGAHPGALRGQLTSAPTNVLDPGRSCSAESCGYCCSQPLRSSAGLCRSSEWSVPLGTPAAGAATAERCSHFAPRCTIVITAWHACPICCAALIRLVACLVAACAELRTHRGAACRSRRLRCCAAEPSRASIKRSTNDRSSRSIIGHVRRLPVQSTWPLQAAPSARACTPVHFGVSCAVQSSQLLSSVADGWRSSPSVLPSNCWFVRSIPSHFGCRTARSAPPHS